MFFYIHDLWILRQAKRIYQTDFQNITIFRNRIIKKSILKSGCLLSLRSNESKLVVTAQSFRISQLINAIISATKHPYQIAEQGPSQYVDDISIFLNRGLAHAYCRRIEQARSGAGRAVIHENVHLLTVLLECHVCNWILSKYFIEIFKHNELFIIFQFNVMFIIIKNYSNHFYAPSLSLFVSSLKTIVDLNL